MFLPLEKKLIDEQYIAIGTRLSALELIKSGVTTFADMYFYNHIIAQSIDEAGLRGVIGVAIPGIEKDSENWDNKTKELIKKYKEHPRLSFAFAPHAPYSVSPELLQEIGEKSRADNIPIIIHVSESLWEQNEIKKTIQQNSCSTPS